MKHCKMCNVDVETVKDYCPLCFNDLQGESVNSSIYMCNTKKETTNKKNYLATRILVFLTMAIIIICSTINFLTYTGVLWVLPIISGLIYLWIFIKHTIISNRNAFEKVFLHLIGLTLLMISTHIVSGGGDWLINYVLPSIAILTNIILCFISMINKKLKNFILGFVVIYVLLLLFSVILLVFKFDTFKILNQINITLTILAIIGTLLLGYKTIKSELSKKLHL